MRARGSISRAVYVLAALLGTSILSLAASCEGTPSHDRIIFRAVAERYRNPRDLSAARIPSAEIDGVRRMVLADPDQVELWNDVLAADRQAADEVDVEIPPALRGAPLQVEVTRAELAIALPVASARAVLNLVLAGVVPNEDATPAVRPSIVRDVPHTIIAPGARERVAYSMPKSDPAHTSLLLVTGRSAQERSYTTGPLAVPAGAHLRFGIGLDEPARSNGPSARFTVTAIADGVERGIFDTRLAHGPNLAWQHGVDYDVDLGGYRGRSVRLRFEATAESKDSRALVFPVWADPRVIAPAAGTDRRRRNLLLISLDTLRADRLGCYGYPRPTSPTIDSRLAAEGTLFVQAYSSYPQTAGSHMTLLTSLEPCVHKILEPTSRSLRPDAHTLAELLGAEGYATAAFTEDGLINAATGFARGFHTFVEDTDEGLSRGVAARTFARGEEWIRTNRGVPWFVFLHTYQTHAPYTPPTGYREEVAWDGPPDDSALYDGEIRYTDDLLAEVLASLDGLGLADDTVVVLTSDHGEQFGEHGLTGHANSLYDELLHVPLIVRAPGLVPSGMRVDAPVGLVDVVPTLLELLDLPPARWTQGRSLVPSLHGDTMPPAIFYAWWRGLVAVRVPGERKWIIDDQGGKASLFVLAADPHEARDVVATAAGQLQAVRARVEARCTASPPPADASAVHPLDPRIREKLKALGYAD